MAVLVLFLSLPFITLLNGWALQLLWGWFIVPVFALAPLSIGAAIGLSMVVSYLTYQYSLSSDAKTQAELLGATVALFVRPVFAVAFGWVVQAVFSV